MNYFSLLFGSSNLIFFHNFNCFLLIIIMVFVSLMYIFLFKMKSMYKFKSGSNFKKVEFYCCMIPIFILIFQMIPSLMILWKSNFLFLNSDLTIKIIGHQWYWSYEIADMLDFQFDSYMKSNESFILGDYNFLEVDNRLIIPYMIPIRLVMTSSDVIHSWTIPSYFIKLDVMAGILTVMNFTFDNIGIFYGQCSEICGANHSFMPIVIEVVPFDFFKNWILMM